MAENGNGNDKTLVNLKGWELARLAYYDETAQDYVPIACITSRNESNSTEKREKVTVCTQGKTKTSIDRIVRTVNIEGEVMDQYSLDEMRTLQDSKKDHYFKTYRDSLSAVYFMGVISELSASYPADGDATFSMTIDLNSEYSNSDLVPVPET